MSDDDPLSVAIHVFNLIDDLTAWENSDRQVLDRT